jgi:hypothetical protein
LTSLRSELISPDPSLLKLPLLAILSVRRRQAGVTFHRDAHRWGSTAAYAAVLHAPGWMCGAFELPVGSCGAVPKGVFVFGARRHFCGTSASSCTLMQPRSMHAHAFKAQAGAARLTAANIPSHPVPGLACILPPHYCFPPSQIAGHMYHMPELGVSAGVDTI